MRRQPMQRCSQRRAWPWGPISLSAPSPNPLGLLLQDAEQTEFYMLKLTALRIKLILLEQASRRDIRNSLPMGREIITHPARQTERRLLTSIDPAKVPNSSLSPFELDRVR